VNIGGMMMITPYHCHKRKKGGAGLTIRCKYWWNDHDYFMPALSSSEIQIVLRTPSKSQIQQPQEEYTVQV